MSRLLDICRQSIYFRSVADLRKCLEAISSDTEVVLVKLKNRLDPDLSSDTSSGYRNLAINLRIVTDQAQALGAETHVCEVQLLLAKMAVLKVSLSPQSSFNTVSLPARFLPHQM